VSEEVSKRDWGVRLPRSNAEWIASPLGRNRAEKELTGGARSTQG
jgi:hypothetical protein